MLDLNHPQTEVIFKASSYIDKLKNYCGKYTIEDFDARQEIFMQMLIVCDAFEQFCQINYANDIAKIKMMLDAIRREVESLSAIEVETEPQHCKVCNGELLKYKSEVKEFGIFYYCHKCPKVIVEKLNELECLTGVMFI